MGRPIPRHRPSRRTLHTFPPLLSSYNPSSSPSSYADAARQPGGFYRNAAVEQYAAKQSSTFSLRQLVFFARGIVGRDDREAEERLVRGANFVRTELPIRIAHRLRDLQSLPYVVNLHPSISQVYRLYTDAFERLRKVQPIRDLKENEEFCKFLTERLDEHRVVIPYLAIGMAESSASAHLHPSTLDDFMTRMLRSRISRRVLTEQHIALTAQHSERRSTPHHGRRRHGHHHPGHGGKPRFVGIIDTELSPAAVVEKCAHLVDEKLDLPVPVIVEGAVEETFSYISDHLEYMIFELLKNSARATVAKHASSAPDYPPIRATIASAPSSLTIRISDQGGGISPPPTPAPTPYEATGGVGAQRREVFSFARLAGDETLAEGKGEGTGDETRSQMRRDVVGALKTLGGRGLSGTVREQVSSSIPEAQEGTQEMKEVLKAAAGGGENAIEKDAAGLARLGIGLPLSAIFAQYFGGSLEMYSVDGFGADAILRIPKLGDVAESAW